jgi:hypothetical protein|tara:strand:+ start:665 stop:856 length:192 start_codon:yes stop_codon:yes gene_type:complete
VKAGDIVRFKEGIRARADLWGIVIDDSPYPPASFLDIKVRVMWQNKNISLVQKARLEVISEGG